MREFVLEGGNVCIDTSVPYAYLSRTPLLHHDFFELLHLVPISQLRVIIMMRDPERLSLSVWRRGLERSIIRACNSVELALLYTRYCSQVSPVSPLEVHYEQLLSKPNLVCQDLSGYLDLDISPTAVASIHPPTGASVPYEIRDYAASFWSTKRLSSFT